MSNVSILEDHNDHEQIMMDITNFVEEYLQTTPYVSVVSPYAIPELESTSTATTSRGMRLADMTYFSGDMRPPTDACDQCIFHTVYDSHEM